MESSNPLPKTLPGAVCEQWRTCGKKRCRCANGQPHGPYYYRFFRVNGRLRKEYVPRHVVAETRAKCQARRDNRLENRLWIALAQEIIRRSLKEGAA